MPSLTQQSGRRAEDVASRFLRAQGLHLRHLIERRQSLEELFMTTVVEAEPGVDPRAAKGAS